MNEASRRSADLLPDVVEAHGGLDRWNAFTTLHATVVSGGDLFVIKACPQDPAPREQTVWLHEERSSVTPFGAADQKTDFTPDALSIQKLDSRIVAERRHPRDAFAAHVLETPWDALDRAYFTATPCGPTSPRRSCSPCQVSKSPRSNPGTNAIRSGAAWTSPSPPATPATAPTSTFTSAPTTCCVATPTTATS